VAPDVPPLVVGDPGRLGQVLVNLVGNAVKFTERGEVVVRVELRGAADGMVELHVVVSDTGIGIPAGKLAVIFEAFTQGDSSTTRRYGGTGLGLAISRQLVELMGGRIWAESEEGRGSVFHFTVRVGVAPAGVEPAAGAGQLDGVPALVVDDNATSRGVLGEMLGLWGLKPTVVDSAEAAWSTLALAQAVDRLPALIITDHRMPGGDGFELARRLRESPALAGIPIIMVSPSTLPRDLTRAREAGIRAYLMKPVTPSELLDAIVTALGAATPVARPRPPAPAPAPAPPSRRLRILVAEDNPVNQKVVSTHLERWGHRVDVVATGRAALAALEQARFDLVLMDLEMPEMDGLAATAAIRASEAEIAAGALSAPSTGTFASRRAGQERLPIVALTAHAVKGTEERCLAAGMDGYLPKPIRADLLRALIERVGGAERGESAGPGTTSPVLADALRALGDDGELLAELAQLFLEDYPRRVAELRAGVASGDGPRVRQAAHALKGSIATFGAGTARRLAARLEHLAEEGHLHEVPVVLEALVHELALVDAAFRRYIAAA
jgi:CheY-like chemotaxis protein